MLQKLSMLCVMRCFRWTRLRSFYDAGAMLFLVFSLVLFKCLHLLYHRAAALGSLHGCDCFRRRLLAARGELSQ